VVSVNSDFLGEKTEARNVLLQERKKESNENKTLPRHIFT
jgi:hypothetical protein